MLHQSNVKTHIFCFSPRPRLTLILKHELHLLTPLKNKVVVLQLSVFFAIVSKSKNSMHNEVRNHAQMLQSGILRNYAKVKTTKTTQMKKSPVKESFAQSNSHRNSFTNDSFVSDPRSRWAWQGSWERFVLSSYLPNG